MKLEMAIEHSSVAQHDLSLRRNYIYDLEEVSLIHEKSVVGGM
jgi:hypothetical protein